VSHRSKKQKGANISSLPRRSGGSKETSLSTIPSRCQLFSTQILQQKRWQNFQHEKFVYKLITAAENIQMRCLAARTCGTKRCAHNRLHQGALLCVCQQCNSQGLSKAQSTAREFQDYARGVNSLKTSVDIGRAAIGWAASIHRANSTWSTASYLSHKYMSPVLPCPLSLSPCCSLPRPFRLLLSLLQELL
jgi:hypothetical protein